MRIVPGAMPKRSARRNAAGRPRRGSGSPNSTDSTSERALNGRTPSPSVDAFTPAILGAAVDAPLHLLIDSIKDVL